MRSIWLKPIVNKINGQINLSLKKKSLPKDMKISPQDINKLKIKIEEVEWQKRKDCLLKKQEDK